MASSSFGWLDYSEQHRRQMLDVIALFDEQTTRDELGIGTVRDVFADLFFPGISTIQTRARYFLFIPWIYRDLERREYTSQEISRRGRRAEIDLVAPLAASADNTGIIGRIAGHAIQRLPSSVYWNGLAVWGIRHVPVSPDLLGEWLAHQRRYANGAGGDAEYDGDSPQQTSNWHRGLPDPPPNFPQGISFALRRIEAIYLRERLLARVPDSLLSWLVDRAQVVEQCEYVWLHPQVGELPSGLREQLEHARNFAEAMHAAALLYNLMLAEQRDDPALVYRYTERLHGWAEAWQSRAQALRQWDRHRFWAVVKANGHIPYATQRFVNDWLIGLENIPDPCFVANNPGMRNLISDRERHIKGARARLHNRRALDLWSGEAGTARLDYRWRASAHQIITDIQKGLVE